MARYQIMSWHGIPTGVKAEDEKGQVRENLPKRFQVAVDAVATAVGRVDTKEYLAGWQWSDPLEREGSARQVAKLVAAELDQSFSPGRVKELRQALEQTLSSK